MKTKKTNDDVLYHTDSLLRKHQVLVEQKGFGDKAKFRLVDWVTCKPVSQARENAYFKEDSLSHVVSAPTQ